MKILLVNDDGYTNPGIWALADAFADRGDSVTVVAPDGQRSATSHAVTLHKPLRLKRAYDFDRPNVNVYHTSGTPVDCVIMGLFKVATDADIVLSGINSGPNLGEDVLYSGTVGAAMEGAMIGKPSIAVSLSGYENPEYDLATAFTMGLVDVVMSMNLPERFVLNVNVPPARADQYRGFRVTRLGTRKYTDVLTEKTDPRGGVYFWIAGDPVRMQDEPDTDNTAISEGLISITPLMHDLTSHGLVKTLAIADPLKRNI